MAEPSPQRYPEWEPLLTWVTLIQTGSFADTSRKLGISQAAVSQRIKLLEEIMGTLLLDRTSRPARPTPAGDRLFEHASGLLRGADQMMEAVRRISRSRRPVVRIGCVDSFAATGGPIIIRALSSVAHQIRLWSGSADLLQQELEQRQVDIAITPVGGPATAGIRRVKLFSEAFVAVLPASAETGQPGSLAELARTLPLIRYSARSNNGRAIEAYLGANGDAIENTCEFDTTEPLLSMVGSGLGFALTTPLCIWQARHHIPQLRVLPLGAFRRKDKPYPDLSRTFYLLYRENDLGPLADELRGLIVQAFTRQVIPAVATALSFKEADLISIAS
ncbi:LysR family transcriptional regulator [Burkholderia sp. 22PA0106]|uniref:LysR family transcriptional regulator n=1 Tax=Burkholderia sp. 22PA0106 TaxID=3237371 RepID=UPI0039C1A0A5